MSRTKPTAPTSTHRLRRTLAATAAAALASGAILIAPSAAQASAWLSWTQPAGPVAPDATLSINVGSMSPGSLVISCDGVMAGYKPNVAVNTTLPFSLTSCGTLAEGQHTISVRSEYWGTESVVIDVVAPVAVAPEAPVVGGYRFDGDAANWALNIFAAGFSEVPEDAGIEVLVDGQDATLLGASFESVSGSRRLTFPFGSLAKGNHELAITQVNADGTRSATHTETLTVAFPATPVVTVSRSLALNGQVSVTAQPGTHVAGNLALVPNAQGQFVLGNYRHLGAQGLSVRLESADGFQSPVAVVYPGDTDNDQLGDHDELLRGTNPTNPDTDGDGTRDGAEVAAGFDPKNPASKPAPVVAPTPVKVRVPSAPRNLRAITGAKGGKLTAAVTWVAPLSTNGAPVTKYRVAATKLDSRNRAVKVYESAYLGANARTVSMALPAGRYMFKVRAWNKAGVSAWSAASNRVAAR